MCVESGKSYKQITYDYSASQNLTTTVHADFDLLQLQEGWCVCVYVCVCVCVCMFVFALVFEKGKQCVAVVVLDAKQAGD